MEYIHKSLVYTFFKYKKKKDLKRIREFFNDDNLSFSKITHKNWYWHELLNKLKSWKFSNFVLKIDYGDNEDSEVFINLEKNHYILKSLMGIRPYHIINEINRELYYRTIFINGVYYLICKDHCKNEKEFKKLNEEDQKYFMEI